MPDDPRHYVIHPDPVLSQVKLIAQPWDAGTGGYQRTEVSLPGRSIAVLKRVA